MASSRDTIVVGAGIIGCAVAYELARRGLPVHVLDERSAGLGATQASAGILAPYIEAAEAGSLLDLTVRSLGLFDEFIANVAADSRMPVSYSRCGTLQVVAADGMPALRAAAQGLAARGVEATLVDAEGVRQQEPSLSGEVAGGLVVRTHGFVSAGELTQALAAAARRLGARVDENTSVRRISHEKGEVVVETERGQIKGGVVVLAAGSWSPRIDRAGIGAELPVRPVRGQLLRLRWDGPPLRRVIWSERCYVVPWNDGTLLVGATVEDAGFDERTTVAGVRDLLEAVSDVIPGAWSAGFLGARAGLRPATPDELPIVGRSRVVPNLVYATGHYRNGVLLAPLTASLVADLLLGREDSMLAAVSPSRFGGL